MPFTEMPGVSIGIRNMLMPACLATVLSVRSRANIQVASLARVVQIFWPLTTHSSPSRTASVRKLARSEPAPGSE